MDGLTCSPQGATACRWPAAGASWLGSRPLPAHAAVARYAS